MKLLILSALLITNVQAGIIVFPVVHCTYPDSTNLHTYLDVKVNQDSIFKGLSSNEFFIQLCDKIKGHELLNASKAVQIVPLGSVERAMEYIQ